MRCRRQRKSEKNRIFRENNPSSILDEKDRIVKKKDENIFLKIQMYMISLWLLFVLMIPLTLKWPNMNGSLKEKIQTALGENVFPMLCLLMTVIGWLLVKQLEYRWNGTRDLSVRVMKAESENFEYLTFLTTYIIPLVCIDLENIRYIVVLIILLVIIGVIFIRSDFYLGNPTLAIMGYRLYRIQYILEGQTEEKLIISKDKVQEGDYVEAIPFDRRTWFVKKV